mgnify:CR=1 FL=1
MPICVLSVLPRRYVDAVTKDIIASGGKACNRC